MNTKKSARIFLLVVFGLLFIGLMSNFVSAPWTIDNEGNSVYVPDGGSPTNSGTVDVANNLKGAAGEVKIFIETLFGSTVFGDEWLSRLFMAMLIAMFVYTVFESFYAGQSKYIKWGATIAVTALALIGFPNEFLDAIRTSYGAMGATILSVVPFLVIFWFSVKTKSLFVARVTWVLFSIYYFLLFLSKWIIQGEKYGGGLLYQITDAAGRVTSHLNPTWVYGLSFMAGVIIFFVIGFLRDGLFREELKSEVAAAKMSNRARAAGLRAEADRLEATTGINQPGEE